MKPQHHPAELFLGPPLALALGVIFAPIILACRLAALAAPRPAGRDGR